MKAMYDLDEEKANKELDKIKEVNKVKPTKPVKFEEFHLSNERFNKHKNYKELVKN